MSDKTESKACPFCGSENCSVLLIGGLRRAQCNECMTSGSLFNTEAEAIAAWNTRQPSDLQRFVDYCKENEIAYEISGAGTINHVYFTKHGSSRQPEHLLHIDSPEALAWLIKTHKSLEAGDL